MPGLSDLVNNITSSVQGLISDLTGNNSSSIVQYHQDLAEYRAIQSQLSQENWAKLSFPYTFAVVKLTDAKADGGFSPFALPLAPQSITQSEGPAIAIKASQGGTTVNHSGLGYKQLISKLVKTFGYLPQL